MSTNGCFSNPTSSLGLGLAWTSCALCLQSISGCLGSHVPSAGHCVLTELCGMWSERSYRHSHFAAHTAQQGGSWQEWCIPMPLHSTRKQEEVIRAHPTQAGQVVFLMQLKSDICRWVPLGSGLYPEWAEHFWEPEHFLQTSLTLAQREMRAVFCPGPVNCIRFHILQCKTGRKEGPDSHLSYTHRSGISPLKSVD